MQLEGTLDTFPLRELIEMVVYSSVTGVLNVEIGSGIGRLYFRDGQPYHALAGDQSGINAVCAMFEQTHSRFSFAAGDVSDNRCGWIVGMIEHGEELARLWRNAAGDTGRGLCSHLVGTIAQNRSY